MTAAPFILLSALEYVTQDVSFKTSFPVAADALQAAKQLLQWCQKASNEATVNAFCSGQGADLSEPFAAALLYTMFNGLCHFSSCMNKLPLSQILLALFVHRASFEPTTNTVS